MKRIRVWVQVFRDRSMLQLQWADPATGARRTRSSGTSDPDEAERARADLEYELNHGLDAGAGRVAWPAFREAFEREYVAPLRKNTRSNYRVALDNFEAVCRPATLKGVTERTLSAFAAGLRERGNLPSTVRVRLQFLRTALRWAVSQRMLPECPHFPRVKVPRRRPQPVPAEAFERLLAVAPDAQTRALLLCGWLAGLRLTEAVLLSREDTGLAPWVDAGRRRIVFPAGFVKADADQWVPLDPELAEALESLPPQPGGAYFRFVGERGRPVLPQTVGDRVAALARRAGVRLTMKSLRRGFGCRYAALVPAQVLQQLMRHASITTTMDYYCNVEAAAEEAVLRHRRNTAPADPSKTR